MLFQKRIPLADLLEALAILLVRSEFDEVLFRIAPSGDRRGASATWRLVEGVFIEETIRRRLDEWDVVCPFQGPGWGGELRLRRRLGRRSLLLDLNLLMEIVQPALAKAAGQIEAISIPTL